MIGLFLMHLGNGAKTWLTWSIVVKQGNLRNFCCIIKKLIIVNYLLLFYALAGRWECRGKILSRWLLQVIGGISHHEAELSIILQVTLARNAFELSCFQQNEASKIQFGVSVVVIDLSLSPSQKNGHVDEKLEERLPQLLKSEWYF